MSNYNTTANVVLSVNGRQAQKVLSSLQEEAQKLERKLAKAASAGDKASMKKLQRELNSTNRLINQLQGSAATAEQVLRRLDKATPKELQKTLRQLRNELNGIERGTAAWDAHVAKIKAVKAEIERVNETLAEQKSLSDRVMDWVNKWQMALVAVGAAITGLVMAGRKAVNAFAEMEQEMANVRKFTDMSAEEVSSLNEEFKKIDTRTPREELNQLAQEAGRLGKTSQEDVLGFVRAADKINVALDDLGSGATLTLSKLTGIFGDEKRLGTEKSLLAVGSVINELSQNCSASAPYLAEFASRMGGVGSQANLTVQQIMGFAAVLDSNNQKLEASATALSQVIVRIYQDPAKYARVAGMDIEKFSKLVKTDMNAALIEFLSTLKQAGNMDVLSPMFKDMGENGSRAISALSTLANHINEVRSQQEVANEAFEEATSIDTEFAVQNNTVQAGLDKAKNRVHELAVELGEKLQPIMRMVISSSTIALRALSAMVDFFIKYRREVVSLGAAILAYTVVVKGSAVATAAWGAVCKVAQGVAAVTRVTLIALRICYFQLSGQTAKAAAATRIFNSVCKASPIGIVVGLVTALVGVLASFISRTREARKALDEARHAEREWHKSLTDISEASAQAAAKEEQRVKSLYQTAISEAKSKDERRQAAEKLQALYPDYFKNLSTEEIMVGKAKKQYDRLRESIINAARAKAAAAKIEENEKELLALEDAAPGLKSKRDSDKRKHDDAVKDWNKARELNNNIGYTSSTDAAAGAIVNVKPYADKVTSTGEAYNASLSAYNENIRKQKQINAANKKLADKYHVAATSADDDADMPSIPTVPRTSVGSGSGGSSGGSSSTADRFAAEREARERTEAEARIAYVTGKKDYLQYLADMNKASVDYYDALLKRTDLSETERLKTEADYYEAAKKQKEENDAALLSQSVNAEKARYDAQMAELKQFYINGSISKGTYDTRTEEYEILHQQKLSNIYEDGSKERLQAEQQLQSLLISQMQRRQRAMEENERKLASMKKEFFGDNPQERQAKYDADLALLQTVYDREAKAAGDNTGEKLRIEEAFLQAKLALQKKYGLLVEEDTRNSAQRAIDSSVEWLNSDGGKAMQGAVSTLTSSMGAIFSSLSSLVQAELELETAAIDKRYESEISAAEGNSYRVKKLEKEKEREIAKAKNEANRKMFAMQVIQAVAQTAQNAISAYGSAAAIPLVGYILAPIAAGMAVAAGMIQIAAIKKQQQASLAQGYSEGGFTPDGSPDEPVGIVHAGEWVASQRLVRSPQTRPLIEALDYAQRTNTVGSLKAADVSRSITAPMVLAQQGQTPKVIVNQPAPAIVVEQNSEYVDAMKRLSQRLNEPFITVNTITGDYGIEKAQEDYDRLLRNKSPKSKKK